MRSSRTLLRRQRPGDLANGLAHICPRREHAVDIVDRGASPASAGEYSRYVRSPNFTRSIGRLMFEAAAASLKTFIGFAAAVKHQLQLLLQQGAKADDADVRSAQLPRSRATTRPDNHATVPGWKVRSMRYRRVR